MKAIEEKKTSLEAERLHNTTLIEQERDELQVAFDKLQEDFRLQKVELRIADRKEKDFKDRVSLLREMLKEEREKREKMEGSAQSEVERIAQLEAELNSEHL